MHDEHKDTQAAKLEQLFLEVTNQESQINDDETTEEYIEIDVLQLPPRREVHKGKRSGLHLSFRSPAVRMTVVIIILLSLIIVMGIFYGEEIIEFFA